MNHPRKIRLIEPQTRAGRPMNAWICRWPLLGPLTLASILEQRGYDVGVYNENISGPLHDNPQAYEDATTSDVVGISIMTPTAARGYEIADRIRADNPGVTLVFGGSHATFRSEEALAHCDLVVRGEAENVIEAVASGELSSGIVDSPPLENLDDIPTLNHWLIRDFDKLLASCRRKELYQLPIMTSRGCPFGCSYCSVTQMFGRKVRRQSPKKAYEDICRHMERGFRHFFFYDDNFTSDRRWSADLLGRLAPLNIRFNAQTRIDFHWLDAARKEYDRELLQAMHKCGGDVLYIGYETIDDATAADWCKGYRGPELLRDRLRQDTAILHDHGFWIHGMFVMGPQHTRQSADQIVRFCLNNQIESMQISILTPFPGTALFEKMSGDLLLREFPGDWDFYDGMHCVVGRSALGLQGLQEAVVDAHRKFYGRGFMNLRRIKGMLEGTTSLREKAALIRERIKMRRDTMRQWRQETARFLSLVNSRLPVNASHAVFAGE